MVKTGEASISYLNSPYPYLNMQGTFRQIGLLLVLFIKQIYKVYRNSSTYFCKKPVIN